MSRDTSTCPPGVARPDTTDEKVETALGYMWCEFAKRVRANDGPADIHWAAVQFARGGFRSRIEEYFQSDATRTPTQFVEGKYVEPDPADIGDDNRAKSYRDRWLETADGCGRARGEIEIGDISRCWAGPYGPPERIPNKNDQAAETIGGQMWYRFTVGVERITKRTGNNGLTVPIDVIARGRELSGNPVYRNSAVCDKGDRIDFSKWDWEGVSICTYQAGRLAADYAYKEQSSMNRDHFGKAWCDVWETMREQRFRLSTDAVPLLSNAC